MYINPRNIFLQQKAVKAVFALGICLAVASGIVGSIYYSNADACADLSYCTRTYSSYINACLTSSSFYCCTSWSSTSSRSYCGYPDCIYIGSGYSDCNSYLVPQWILAGLAILVLIILIVMHRQHLLRTRTALLTENMAQNNVIYSDPRNAPVRN